jgi:hypothetical protein
MPTRPTASLLLDNPTISKTLDDLAKQPYDRAYLDTRPYPLEAQSD